MKKLVKVLACVLALALGIGSALAVDSVEVPVASDGSFVITIDTTGKFTTAENEYARTFFQTYGDAITVTKVTMVYDGAEVDITDYAVIDGSDGNYTVYINPETDAATGEVKVEGYFSDNSTLDKVTAVSYYVTKGEPADAEAAWWGGAAGTNSLAGWLSVGQWSSSADDMGNKEMILVDAPEDAEVTEAPAEDAETPATDNNTPATGDATSIVALALVAVVAMGGVVVCSKKRA